MNFRPLFAHLDSDPEWRRTCGRMDAEPSVFVDRALNFVMAEVFNTKIPPLKGVVFVPRRSTTPPGAKTVTYKQYTRAGIAQFMTAPGQDLPSTSVWVKEFTNSIFTLGDSYNYTIMDLLAAAMASANMGGAPLNIDMQLAAAALIGIEKKLDNIARLGSDDGLSPDLGLTGLLNNANATLYTIPNGAGGFQAWSTKTPDEMAQDMHGIAYAQVASTFEVEAPDTLGLPLAQFGLVSTKRMGDGSNVTIADFVKATSPWIKNIEGWQYLKEAGAGSTDRMLCYSRDPSKVWQEVPVPFRQEAPQMRDLAIRVACWASSGGVIIPYPLSVSYGDGI